MRCFNERAADGRRHNDDVDDASSEDDDVDDGGTMRYHDNAAATSRSRDPASRSRDQVAGRPSGGSRDRGRARPSYMDYVDDGDGDDEVGMSSDCEENVMVAPPSRRVERLGDGTAQSQVTDD